MNIPSFFCVFLLTIGFAQEDKSMPSGIAECFTLFYTSSGLLKVEMRSDKYLDYSNMTFKYHEFIDNVEVIFLDTEKKRNTINADYAIAYQQTSIVELSGNVVLTTHDGSMLKTTKLFWNQKDDWVFTEEKFNFFNMKDGTIMDGKGMDFDRNFDVVKAHKTYGVVTIEDEK